MVRDAPSAFSTYPAGRIVAVIDRPATSPEVVAALRAEGFAGDDIDVLQGTEARIAAASRGRLQRAIGLVRRWFAFTLMDQLPDFVLYERALKDGRAVVLVRVRSDREKGLAHAVLRRHGAHFTNHYGRFATEELDLWRGPEPEMPDFLRR